MWAPALLERVFRSAAGSIAASRLAWSEGRRPTERISELGLARDLMRTWGDSPGANLSAARSVARRALASEAMAARLRDAPNDRPGAREFARAPFARADRGQYVYRAAVHFAGTGGQTDSFVTNVVSDRPLTGAEVEAHVRAHVDQWESPERARRRRMAALTGEVTVSRVVVVSAYRAE